MRKLSILGLIRKQTAHSGKHALHRGINQRRHSAQFGFDSQRRVGVERTRARQASQNRAICPGALFRLIKPELGQRQESTGIVKSCRLQVLIESFCLDFDAVVMRNRQIKLIGVQSGRVGRTHTGAHQKPERLIGALAMRFDREHAVVGHASAHRMRFLPGKRQTAKNREINQFGNFFLAFGQCFAQHILQRQLTGAHRRFKETCGREQNGVINSMTGKPIQTNRIDTVYPCVPALCNRIPQQSRYLLRSKERCRLRRGFIPCKRSIPWVMRQISFTRHHRPGRTHGNASRHGLEHLTHQMIGGFVATALERTNLNINALCASRIAQIPHKNRVRSNFHETTYAVTQHRLDDRLEHHRIANVFPPVGSIKRRIVG